MGVTIPSFHPQPLPPIFGSFGSMAQFPLQVELSPLVLAVLLMLAGIFVATVSVVLIYHWRRFPFEHGLFRWVERLYLAGVVGLLAVAVIGIFLS